MPDIRMDEITR